MQNKPVDRDFAEDLMAKIRYGLIEGVRREVERRRKLGLPLYVGHNGRVQMITADGTVITEHPAQEDTR